MATGNRASKFVKFIDDKLTDIIEESQKSLSNAIQTLERQIIRLVDKVEVDVLGRFKRNATSLQAAVDLHKQVTQLFVKEYDRTALKHVRGFSEVEQTLEQSFSQFLGLTPNFTLVDRQALDVLRKQDYQLHKSLSKNTQNQIARAVYASVLTLRDRDALAQEIAQHLTGGTDARGRPLTQYANTYAQDQIMQYHAALNKIAGEEAGANKWLYVGTVIETSRDFCEHQAGLIRTTEEWTKIGIEQEWHGKSCNDIFLCRGGYNCRHHFQPVFN